MLIATKYEHIKVDDRGMACIGETDMKVTQLVAEKMAFGWSAEELHLQHPYLSLGQIHSALAYYWDHEAELAALIRKELEFGQQLQIQNGPSPLKARLRTLGLPQWP